MVVPVRPEPNQFLVEFNADAAAHADDHGLAVHCLQSVLEVGDEVLGDLGDPISGSYNGLQLGPFCLEALLVFNLLALGGLLEVGVYIRLFRLVQHQLG